MATGFSLPTPPLRVHMPGLAKQNHARLALAQRLEL